MKPKKSDPETRQFHVKLFEWKKLRWMQDHVSRRLKALTGAKVKAPPAAAIDMALDTAHCLLSNPDLTVVKWSAVVDMLNEHHLAAVEQAILKMFGPDYKNLTIRRNADGSLSGAHDGQKAEGGKSAVFNYPAQIFGADRGEEGIRELLNKSRPSMPMVG